jgi:uracil-DNA glycosylase
MDMLKVLEYEYKDIILKELDTEARVVFGDGNPNAKVVLIGEAPGKKEEETGKAFVGSAGKNLDEFLNILELKREDIYITNVVKIRPYKVNKDTERTTNRTPNKKEIDISIKTLISQLEIIKPKIVVTLGNIPLRAVLGDDNAKIGDYHGSKFKLEKYDLFPLYHPASIIYNRSLYETYLEDVIKLKEYI